jgi:hypothetical protein
MHARILRARRSWKLESALLSIRCVRSLNASATLHLPTSGLLVSLLSRNPSSRSFRHCRAQNLRPEEPALCPLNNLLVDGLWGVVHDDRAGLVVDLCVDTGVADEVDDPLLALVLREAEAG